MKKLMTLILGIALGLFLVNYLDNLDKTNDRPPTYEASENNPQTDMTDETQSDLEDESQSDMEDESQSDMTDESQNDSTDETQSDTTDTTVASGSCGETITWILDKDGTLTVRGKGAIVDYEKGANNQPWMKYRKSIITLIIDEGITRIGDRAFQSCNNIVNAIIGNDVASIGEWAFQNCYALSGVEVESDVKIETGAFRSTPVEWEIGGLGDALYRSSSYYEALSQVVLTGNYRENIINIALSQVGYHEGDGEEDYAGDNVDGSNDYTEYGRRLDSLGSAWCSEFASWCIRMAEVPEQIIASSRSANVANFTKDTSATCYTWEQTTYGGGSYVPRNGDILLWAWDKNTHNTEENLSHTSLFVEAAIQENGIIVLKTVDGNSNNRVEICNYKVNTADGSLNGRTGRLCYIISPDYE